MTKFSFSQESRVESFLKIRLHNIMNSEYLTGIRNAIPHGNKIGLWAYMYI